MAQNLSTVWLLIKGWAAVIFRRVLWKSSVPTDSFLSLVFLHVPIQTTRSQEKQRAFMPSSAAQSCLAIFCSVPEKAKILLLQLLLVYLTCMHWSGWPWPVGVSYKEPPSLHSPSSPLLTSLSSTSPSREHLVHWTYHPFACLRNNPVSSLSWSWMWWRQVSWFS